MSRPSRTFSDWPTLLLGLGSLLVAGLTLGPLLAPRPMVPAVTHQALPAVGQTAALADAEPPTYPTTPDIQPLVSGRLNLNTATLEQLETLPKVGPSLAKKILDGRPYRDLNDLDAVKGIGPSALKRLAPLVKFHD